MSDEGCLTAIILTIVIAIVCGLIGKFIGAYELQDTLKEQGYARVVLDEDDNSKWEMIPIDELVPQKSVPKMPTGKWYFIVDEESPTNPEELSVKVDQKEIKKDTVVYTEEDGWGSAKSFSLVR